jgi:pilus assembly protein CpaB
MAVRRFLDSPHTVRSRLTYAAAALLAIATARTVATDLAALHARAREAGPAADVVVAARDLPLGVPLRVRDLSVRRAFTGQLPPGSLRSPDDAVGRVVTTPVLSGSVLTARHLAPADRNGLDGLVPPGMRAVRVSAEGADWVAPGSVVDLFVTFDPAAVGPDTDPTQLAVGAALVIAAGTADGVGGATDDGFDGTAPGAGLTVLTDPDGARRLAFAAAHGILTVALAPPEEAAPAREG